MAPIKSFAKAAFAVQSPLLQKLSTTSSTTSTIHPSLLDIPSPITDLANPLSTSSSYSLERMCELFKATPVDNLLLTTSSGERGVILRNSVKQNEVILSIPLESCFRDDEPPHWYERRYGDDGMLNEGVASGGMLNGIAVEELYSDAEGEEHDITDYERYNPSAWASRLAASLLDFELIGGREEDGSDIDGDDDDLKSGRKMWQSLLPNKDILRSSLPVHWGEAVLSTSKCTALELAVDSAYFARANAVMNLAEELRRGLNGDHDWGEGARTLEGNGVLGIALDMEALQRKCHDALDIVQTRACRVERTCEDGVQWGPPLRILAPIFDFINHGSSAGSGREGSANASFRIENERMCDMHEARLVVRALRDISEGEEVLIDYGDSARPAWRCLTSYGFVPDYDINVDDDLVDEEHVENVAELWMNGLRFEVDPHSVPFDLVEVAAAQALLDHDYEDDELEEAMGKKGVIPPFVARALAKRATLAAFNLITEPEMVGEEDWDSPDFVHASSLAALLRWSQHNVLLKFADNLKRLIPSTSSSPLSKAE